ncbi:Molybdenum cofactor guanylyltransferase [Pleomorphomonas sp. T1.2MG-36]|uniref:molybdenum cofactor guanylyltransferase MobA n=1 Tax=Pleomorphomonas sp. T1.2MG-36 TaxID=3041167 RepID=UPI0024778712|nr:molybdenum cofactor guanylyltransferase MobA [Pleomorphomonas sp. T1.2MG-36]CAI9406722.1 Molybdenum cofactor guanylyltransferase [Pleomorphomonas sp. T1.2MG-36]
MPFNRGMTMFAGLILAGGRSSRMGGGTPKALVELAGATLLARVAATLSPQVVDLAVNPPPGVDFSGLDLPVVRDGTPTFEGPLAGVLAGLAHASALSSGPTHLLTAPVDLPFLPSDLADRLAAGLIDADTIAFAEGPAGRAPLCALWPLSVAARLEAFLAGGPERRVGAFLAGERTRGIRFAPVHVGGKAVDPFFNINTPDDLAFAEKMIGSVRP